MALERALIGELVWKSIQIAAWILVALSWYFNDAGSIKERVAVAETRIEQETLGYRLNQVELARRLERLEEKMDRIMERQRICHRA